MKQCSKCRNKKPLAEFAKNSGKKDGLNPTCKPCMREYNKKHYEDNKQYYLDKAKYHSAIYDRIVGEIIDNAKDVPCLDCGNKFPSCAMDFDHVRGVKEFNVSNPSGRPIEVVVAEIAKCEVVCACCHRIRTEERRLRP